MKKTTFVLITLVLVLGSCKKEAKKLDREAFIGNYHVTQVEDATPCSSTKYTIKYDMTITAGSSDSKIVFRNLGDNGSIDTATVSGSLATFDNSYWATSATISGSNLVISFLRNSCTIHTGTATKF